MKTKFKILLSSMCVLLHIVNSFSQVSFFKNDTTSQLHNINKSYDYDFQDTDITQLTQSFYRAIEII